MCVFKCFVIKGLCPILDKNGFCRMPLHTCVAECVWNGRYICQGGGGGWHHFLRMYLWSSLCTLCLHACQVKFTVSDSGLLCPLSVERYWLSHMLPRSHIRDQTFVCCLHCSIALFPLYDWVRGWEAWSHKGKTKETERASSVPIIINPNLRPSKVQ